MSDLTRFKHLKIAVGVPSPGHWVTDFGVSFCNLIVYFQQHRVLEYKSQVLQTVSVKGSILPKQRREIVKSAMDFGADYLLWIDSDHTFPRNMLHRLMSHQKDVVAVNCVTKRVPSTPTARYRPDNPEDLTTSRPVFSDPNKPELEKVWRVGCGVMLVNMRVYKATGPEIFHMFYRPEVDNYQGEDWSMCEAIEKHGFDIWVDHPLSNQVGHVGLYEYTHDVVGEIRTDVVLANEKAA